MSCRLIARFAFMILLLVAAPFSIGSERPAGPEVSLGALAETGQVDTRIGVDDPNGPSQESAADIELLVTDADAQEYAVFADSVWCDALRNDCALGSSPLSVPSPVLAALDRPPRRR
jgi:hypothetical protein